MSDRLNTNLRSMTLAIRLDTSLGLRLCIYLAFLSVPSHVGGDSMVCVGIYLACLSVPSHVGGDSSVCVGLCFDLRHFDRLVELHIVIEIGVGLHVSLMSVAVAECHCSGGDESEKVCAHDVLFGAKFLL